MTRTLRPLAWATLVATLLLAHSTQAAAQSPTDDRSVPAVNLQRWRPATNPGDYLTVFGSGIDNHLRFTGGLYFNYADDPLLMRTSISAEKKGVIDYQMFADVFASVALFEWVEVGLALPVGLAEGTETGGVPFDRDFTATGLGDLRLTAKGRILRLDDGPIGLAIVATAAMPTGDQDAFYGDDGFGFDAVAAVEYNPYGRIRLGVNAGYRFRPGTIEVERFTLGDSVLLSGAASLPIFSENLDLLAEVHGEVTVDGDNESLVGEERPVEGELGFRYRLVNEPGWADDLALTAALGFGTTGPGSPTTRFILGVGYQWVNGGSWSERYGYGGYLGAVEECPDPATTPADQIPEICRTVEPIDSDGDGVPDSIDNCPFKGVAGQIDERGCPNTDMDGDGILDGEDKCPQVPEDKDGWQDRDGCPDLDNDGDGIADLADKCPLEPEVINGIDDADGCPDDDPNARVSVSGGKVNIKEQVFFETGKDKIKSESFPLLNDVAKLLKDNPHIGNIEIEGHTDDRGDDAPNKDLSQRRADSVLRYLADKGVDLARLKAIGYGEERPIADNETKEGRAKNRRVEFTIRGIQGK